MNQDISARIIHNLRNGGMLFSILQTQKALSETSLPDSAFPFLIIFRFMYDLYSQKINIEMQKIKMT